MVYRTLNNEIIDLTFLPDSHRKIYEEAKQFAKQEPDWGNFTNFLIKRVESIGVSVDAALFKILQDIGSRLAIRQGLVRQLNWRDDLESLITERFKSRYAFCKATRVSQGHLSAVLAGKKDFSLPNLKRMLDRVGFKMVLVKADTSLLGEE